MKENYNIESITSFEKEWIRKDEVLKLIEEDKVLLKPHKWHLKQKIEGKK